jgi:hypothetical protein
MSIPSGNSTLRDALIGRVPLKLHREANLDHIRTTGSIEEPP